MAFLTEPHAIRNNSATSMLETRMLHRDIAWCSVLGRRPWCGKRRVSSTPLATSAPSIPAMQPPPKRSRIYAPKSWYYRLLSHETHRGNHAEVGRHSRGGPRIVTIAEHNNVYHPGRTVSSRDELRGAWLGPIEHRTILHDVARDLIRLKQQPPNEMQSDDAEECCGRGLESLHVDESCRPEEPRSRMVVHHVVLLYRDGQPKSTCGSATSESHSQAERLRFWYRVLTQCDRQLAERRARLDRLEVLQEAIGPLQLLSEVIPCSSSSC